MKKRLLLLLLGCALLGCQSDPKSDSVSDESTSKPPLVPPGLSRSAYYDKVLGLLVGSAIGEMLTASTQMAQHADPQPALGSEQGTWRLDLSGGALRDDSRWKQLVGEFVLTQKFENLRPDEFAEFLLHKYRLQLDSLQARNRPDFEPFDSASLRVGWLHEWAPVARSFAARDIDGYHNALSRFLGGEPSAAGMLYGPLLGACTPADPPRAYEQAYRMAIFDLGYARDLTALTAAMTSAGLSPTAAPEDLLSVAQDVDPQRYYRSPKESRSAYRLLRQAQAIVTESRNLTERDVPVNLTVPQGWQDLDRLGYHRVKQAYQRLDAHNEALAFHPGDTYRLALTAMIFADFDYVRTMEFIVNYGRNTTLAAATAGAILGTLHGAGRLPKIEVDRAIRLNREQRGIDLPKLADQLAEEVYRPVR